MTRRLLYVSALLVAVALPLSAQSQRVSLKDAQGKDVGTATLTAASAGGVTIAYDFRGLTPGTHALHFHQTAKCEPPFTSAGGHFNPEAKKHGLQNPEGPHAGDMPNITVGADGTAKGSVTNQRVSLGSGANSLYANGGTALMIHAGADDNKTDPAGAAGDRVACGVITK